MNVPLHGAGFKRCSSCGAEKPRGDFYAHPCGRDGLFHSCKACHRSDVSANRRAKREYYNAQARARYSRLKLERAA